MEPIFRNPGRFLSYGQPEAVPTIDDLEVEAVMTEHAGVSMQWRSVGRGIVATFPAWVNLETNKRLADPDWWPVGTEAEPFTDAAQDWVFRCWADDDWVYVVEGYDIASWERRYRVPREAFRRAWRRGAALIRASVPPPQIDNPGGSFAP
jgi:hypothetical protein